MPSFDVCWNRRRLQWRHHSERAPFIAECVLMERVLLAGQPQVKVICKVASVIEDRIDDPGEADRFWDAARRRLGRLQRLTGRDRDDIERLLAAKVPRPVPKPPAVTAVDARRHTDSPPMAPGEWNGNHNDRAFPMVGVPA
jgi:hypothetical protein